MIEARYFLEIRIDISGTSSHYLEMYTVNDTIENFIEKQNNFA